MTECRPPLKDFNYEYYKLGGMLGSTANTPINLDVEVEFGIIPWPLHYSNFHGRNRVIVHSLKSQTFRLHLRKPSLEVYIFSSVE